MIFSFVPRIGFRRARAQSAVADGARNRNRMLRVHGINAPCLTAHKPPFPNLRIMLLISIILFITSITKFLPEQRVDRDGMIQLRARSSTSTSTSTSTKNSQNKIMHRSGRSASLNFRNLFGGHSVMVVVRASQSHAHSSYDLGPRVALSHRSPRFVSWADHLHHPHFTTQPPAS